MPAWLRAGSAGRYHSSYLMNVCWSPVKPAVFCTVRSDGVLDIWDFLFHQKQPSLTFKVGPQHLCDPRITPGPSVTPHLSPGVQRSPALPVRSGQRAHHRLWHQHGQCLPPGALPGALHHAEEREDPDLHGMCPLSVPTICLQPCAVPSLMAGSPVPPHVSPDVRAGGEAGEGPAGQVQGAAAAGAGAPAGPARAAGGSSADLQAGPRRFPLQHQGRAQEEGPGSARRGNGEGTAWPPRQGPQQGDRGQGEPLSFRMKRRRQLHRRKASTRSRRMPRSVCSSCAFLSPPCQSCCRDKATVPKPGSSPGLSALLGWQVGDPAQPPEPSAAPWPLHPYFLWCE